jgi:hypothetical protein
MSDSEAPRDSLFSSVEALSETWSGPVVVSDLAKQCCEGKTTGPLPLLRRAAQCPVPPFGLSAALPFSRTPLSHAHVHPLSLSPNSLSPTAQLTECPSRKGPVRASRSTMCSAVRSAPRSWKLPCSTMMTARRGSAPPRAAVPSSSQMIRSSVRSCSAGSNTWSLPLRRRRRRWPDVARRPLPLPRAGTKRARHICRWTESVLVLTYNSSRSPAAASPGRYEASEAHM